MNTALLKHTRPHALLINTSRGMVVETQAVLSALRSGQLTGYAADVYEGEACVFFRNCPDGINDPLLSELLHEPRVLLTPHQAFFTAEALENIATTTLENVSTYLASQRSANFLT